MKQKIILTIYAIIIAYCLIIQSANAQWLNYLPPGSNSFNQPDYASGTFLPIESVGIGDFNGNAAWPLSAFHIIHTGYPSQQISTLAKYSAPTVRDISQPIGGCGGFTMEPTMNSAIFIHCLLMMIIPVLKQGRVSVTIFNHLPVDTCWFQITAPNTGNKATDGLRIGVVDINREALFKEQENAPWSFLLPIHQA